MHNDINGEECTFIRQKNPINLGTLVFLKKSNDEEEEMMYRESRKEEIRSYIQEIQREKEERIKCLENYKLQMANAEDVKKFRDNEIKYVYLENFIKMLNDRERKLTNELQDRIEYDTVCTS